MGRNLLPLNASTVCMSVCTYVYIYEVCITRYVHIYEVYNVSMLCIFASMYHEVLTFIFAAGKMCDTRYRSPGSTLKSRFLNKGVELVGATMGHDERWKELVDRLIDNLSVHM